MAHVYRTIQLVLGGLVVVILGLAALARRFPNVGWLQVLRFNAPSLSEEQRARIRQRSNINAGIEMILLGIILPLLYLGGTVMFFNEPTTTGILLATGASALLIGLGVTAIWQNRRR
jgi:hypothetical protein